VNYELSIDIDAPSELVWNVLTDVERWPEWAASMLRLTYVGGDHLAPGSRVHIKQPRLPAMVWEVTELVPHQSFSWTAKSAGMTIIGSHRLTSNPAGGVTVEFGLRQTGALSWLIGPLTASRTRRYVRMEAEGLKRSCEATAKSQAKE
jgi:uncharacterized protein YndB with AHSA1/START domain